jgi:uncharacterized protein (DUF1330 family)
LETTGIFVVIKWLREIGVDRENPVCTFDLITTKSLENYALISSRFKTYGKEHVMVTNVPVYALNLFDIVDREEYLAYSKRSAREVAAHGGKLVALGHFRETQMGDITPRQMLILVEWESREAFQRYLDDPAIADLHPHREKGAGNYIWHLFDRLEDLRPILKV